MFRSPYLLRADRCRLVVVALETRGRWSEEGPQFVESLAVVRARDAPHALFHSNALAWRRWWARMIVRPFVRKLFGSHSNSGACGCAPLADLRWRSDTF